MTDLAAEIAAERERRFEAELAATRNELRLGLAEADRRAADAEARATYAERRADELEAALGRRRRRQDAARLGLERFRLPTNGAGG